MRKILAAAAAGGLALGIYGLRRPPRFLTPYHDASTKLVIVGGGFGGLAVAEELARVLGDDRSFGALLIDRVNYTTFWPMVPSAISGDVEVRHAARSLRRLLLPHGIEFCQSRVEGIDFEAKKIRTGFGDFPYDRLVLAPGSRTAFFGAEGAQEHAFDIKGLTDALKIRSAIIDRFEEAERRGGRVEDGLLTFVFVGGGPTGVEAVADAHDLIFGVLKKDYPRVDFDRVRLVLINSEDRILDGLDPALSNAATRRLAALRVEILYDTKAKEVRPDSVVLSDGSAIPARTIVWAAGVEPPGLVRNLDAPKDHSGNLLVDEHLRLEDRPGVYAVGDCTTIDYDGPPVPALAQAAEQEGEVAARNLAAEFTGESPEPFRYRSLGQLVDLGGESALVDILGVRTGGLVGELVWKGVYFYELGDHLNRSRVLFDWTIDAVSRPDTSRIFF